jgi:hypothetical protein
MRFFICQSGDLSTSVASGRFRPGLTSPIHRATMASCQCSIYVSFYCVPFASYMRFSYAVKHGGLSVLAARGRAVLEVMSTFDSSVTVSYFLSNAHRFEVILVS